MTINYPKELVDPMDPDKNLQSCGEYQDSDYDGCIEKAVLREMGRLFGCRLPFLRPDPTLEECNLANISDHLRKHVYDTFTGWICLLETFH